MAKTRVIQCEHEHCPNPIFKYKDRDKHRKKYHQLVIKNLVFQGSVVSVPRDPSTTKFPCPCGAPEHSRFSSINIHLLCRQNPHPADPFAYPDSDDETASLTVGRPNEMLLPSPDDEMEVDEHESASGAQLQVVAMDHELLASYSQPNPPLHQSAPFSSLVTVPQDSTAMERDQMDFTEGVVSVGIDAGLTQDLSQREVLNGSDHINVMTAAEARALLKANGIDVEPQFRLTICVDCAEWIHFDQIIGHRRSQHCETRGQSLKLGSKESLTKALEALNANMPLSIPSYPISPIRTLQLLTAYRCGVAACQQRKIFSSKKLVYEHCATVHAEIPARHRPFISLSAQRLGRFRGTVTLIEVIPPPPDDCLDDALSDIIRHSNNIISATAVSFQLSKNVRGKSEFLAKTRWDIVLQDVDLRTLRAAVCVPDEVGEPLLVRLNGLARRYYHHIAVGLDRRVSTLVLRYIHSADPEKDLKKLPFHKPEQSDTIDRDSDFIALFTCFLIRTQKSPVPSYDVVLHPQTLQRLQDLQGSLAEGSEEEIMDSFHKFLYSLLANPSPEFLADEWKDPFRLFLIAAHLQDDHGTFSRTPLIPPTISKAQWGFRATCAKEIQIRKEEFGGDCFAAYTKYVMPFLTEKKPTMFNILREQMSMISTLAHLHPGLPLFSWDVTMQNLSIDGQVLPMNKFIKSMHGAIESISALLRQLFRGHDYEDILKYIDSRLDPKDPERWFRDRPQCVDIGTSVFHENDNEFSKYRHRLLKVMSCDPAFFIRVDQELVAKAANLRQWFGPLDELIKLVFFTIISTWGGGARGTECDHLQYEIQDNSQRNLYILNGLLTIVTYYVKTRSHHGHGSMIARTVPWQLARLLLLIYGVVFPAASHLAAYAFDQQAAVAYRSYMFVLSGRIMTSNNFTKTIASQTSKMFDISMGLRRYRQTMCTILTNIANVNFGELDPDDEDLIEIHYMFAHSPTTGARNYAIQRSNALREISHTTVASSQRVCLAYHAALQLLHPNMMEELHPSSVSLGHEINISQVVPPLTTAVERALQNSAAEIQDKISTVFTDYAQGLSAQVLQRVSHINHTAIPPTQNPSIMVHPGLLRAIKPLLPYGKSIAFTSAQQADAIQSCTSDFHVLIVMPTGSGKSLAFFAAPLLMPNKMFIVITPLVALTNDMSRRLASTGIEGGKWSPSIDPFTAQLVLVSAHQAATTEFFLWAKTNCGRISRLFVDEAHHIFTSDGYRPCFKLFDMLTELGKPITFLSATIFPHSVPHLCERMRIDPSLLIQIRAPTFRPNLRIRVTKCENFESMLTSLKALFESIQIPAEDRGLIFCTTTDACKAVAKLLCIDYYIARLKPTEDENTQERLRLEAQWREGMLPQHRWMVATLCFGQGIDFARVRWVIHLEVRSLLTYAQEMGRAGRDDNLAFVHTFYTRPPLLTDRSSLHDHEGVGFMIEYLEVPRCRRLTLGTLDDVAHSCVALGGELCDYCEGISLKPISALRQQLRLDLPTEHLPPNKRERPLVLYRTLSTKCASKSSSSSDPAEKCPNPHHKSSTQQLPADIATSISVASNAKILQDQRAIGESELELLRNVLDSISMLGCVDCWYLGAQVDRSTLPHNHNYGNLFRACASSLKSKKFPEVRHWPFCYCCWVPFHAPCFHPPHKRHGIADPAQCPYSDYLPHLVTLIWHDHDKRKQLERHFAADFSQFPVFANWLIGPGSTADQIPRPHQWVLAYFREYQSLPSI